MRTRLGLLLVLGGLSVLACDDSSPPSTPVSQDAGTFTTDGGASEGGTSGDGGVVVDCAKPTGGPTEHQGTIGADETWTADKSPHVVVNDVAITAKLTIEPCAEVLLGSTRSLSVGVTGSLVAEGSATKPIHIGARDPAKPFARIWASGGGTIRLAYATVDGGGDPENSIVDVAGMLHLQGVDQYQPTQPTLFVDHVTIAGSKSNGINMLDGAGFAPGSQELTVKGSAQYPVGMWARALGGLPSGKYSGNAHDEILLDGGGGSHAIHEDTTMHNRGVPYRVGNSLSGNNAVLMVERQAPSSPGLATLTIEAGVKVRMKKYGTVYVQRFTGDAPAQGALVVNGTAAEPVVFTSAEATPAAGDWYGIWFGLVPAANNKFDHARVEFAGATSGSGSNACNPPTLDAAIRIFGLPSSAFVTNTEIVNSARHGIDRGWASDTKTDFIATNTFTNVAGCKQTYPRDTNGSCPSVVPCP
jgi:hypothetical protein